MQQETETATTTSQEMTAGTAFKIMTFNVLAQVYIYEKRYSYASKLALSWDHRFAQISQKILHHNCDIICLQEVEQEHFVQFWVPLLEQHGYAGVMQQKRTVGNATFWKQAQFVHKSCNHRSRAMLHHLEHVANPQKQLLVANVHLHGTEHVERFCQIKSVIKYLQQMHKNVDCHKQCLVICGDFNATESSGIYKLLQTGTLESSYLNDDTQLPYTKTDYQQPYELQSAYAAMHKGQEPLYTFNVENMRQNALDFVFYSHLTMVCKQAECSVLNEFLPSEKHGSDHLPVVAHFEIK